MTEPSATRDSEPSSVPAIPPSYRALIASDRVGARLRQGLLERAEPDDPAYEPRSLTGAQLWTLRAVLDRVIPQEPRGAIDLAARLDRMMADAGGNGWRYEALPTDPDAYRAALETLEALARGRFAQSFVALAEEDQDGLLRRLQDGGIGIDGRTDRLDAAAMALWFEELRSDAVRQYVAHPATLARLGYSGIANGGAAGAGFTGFQNVGIGEREAFEPAPGVGRAGTAA